MLQEKRMPRRKIDRDLVNRCCKDAQIEPNSKKVGLVDQAAQFADDWYAQNPMPCGSGAAVDQHHQACRSHVESEMRMTCGVISLLTIISCLLSICYTVWRWRHEASE